MHFNSLRHKAGDMLPCTILLMIFYFNSLRHKAGDINGISNIIIGLSFQFTPAQSRRQILCQLIDFSKNFNSLRHKAGDGNSIQTTPLLITIFYTKHPILHLHPLIPLPKQIINHSFISANPSIYLCSLTFRTTLYCFYYNTLPSIIPETFSPIPTPNNTLLKNIFDIPRPGILLPVPGL